MVAKKATTSTPKKTVGSGTAKKAAPAKASAARTSSGTVSGGTGGTQARTSAPVATDAPPATQVSDAPVDSAPVGSTATSSVESTVAAAAAETLRGSKIWGTGRDRDIRLKKAGLDPEAVAAERNRLRAEERKNKNS